MDWIGDGSKGHCWHIAVIDQGQCLSLSVARLHTRTQLCALLVHIEDLEEIFDGDLDVRIRTSCDTSGAAITMHYKRSRSHERA